MHHDDRHRSGHRPRSHATRNASRSWRPTAFMGPWQQTVDFYTLVLLFATCALGGGTAFADVPSLLYVRPVAVICLILFGITPASINWRMIRVPSTLLALLAVLMVVQLLPLPPSIWTAFPGRTPYMEAATAAGIAQPWRPISLTPDLTLNSLVSLVVPAAVLLGVAKLRDDQRRATILLLIILCLASAMMGVAQFAGGADSPLYLYRRTYPGFPVGLLSNRNHQASLLSLLFPALRLWTLMPAGSQLWRRNRQRLALGLAVLIVPVVLATGSRAGIALMILGIATSILLFPFPHEERSRMQGLRRSLLVWAVPIAGLAGLIVITYWLGRAASIERLVSLSAGTDQRFQFMPTVLRIVRETFPIGTGFGSFDPVFRQYEPDEILISSVFNHAHNELLELTMTGGIAGLLLLVALLIWLGRRLVASIKGRSEESRVMRLGGLVVSFLLLASLVDYPLRPPLMAAIFALACCWLAGQAPAGTARIVTSIDEG